MLLNLEYLLDELIDRFLNIKNSASPSQINRVGVVGERVMYVLMVSPRMVHRNERLMILLC